MAYKKKNAIRLDILITTSAIMVMRVCVFACMCMCVYSVGAQRSFQGPWLLDETDVSAQAMFPLLLKPVQCCDQLKWPQSSQQWTERGLSIFTTMIRRWKRQAARRKKRRI